MASKDLRIYLQVLCGIVLLGFVMGAAAQKSSPVDTPPRQSDTATLHVTTRLVVLDVVVLDKAGHPVSNLDRLQFSIAEDNIAQTLRNFDPPPGHTMPRIGALPVVNGTADLAKIGNAPVNILVFDELNTKWDQTAYARMEMEKYLKAQPDVLAVPTLLVAAGNSKFVVLHDYTQSRADLLESIRTHFPQYPFQMMRGSSGNSAIERMEQTLGTLSQIAESSRGTPGRKNVIWVGSGYSTIDTTNLIDDDEEKLMAVIRRVTDRMLAARVTLYMVDPAGVAANTEDSAVVGGDGDTIDAGVSNVGPYTGKLDFATFATATGGEIFSNRNDVDFEIGKGVRDGEVYYTLSYSPTNGSDDAQKYRQIRVKLKDPSLRAITRDGYFSSIAAVDPVPTGGAKPVNQLQFDLVSAARTRLAYNGLKVEATRQANGYVLLVGAQDLHWEEQADGSRLAEVTVMTVFFNAKDKKLQDSTVELKEKIGKASELNGKSEIALKLPLSTPAAATRIRFVVRDAATGVLGTADAKP